jgi:hypothetical protein
MHTPRATLPPTALHRCLLLLVSTQRYSQRRIPPVQPRRRGCSPRMHQADTADTAAALRRGLVAGASEQHHSGGRRTSVWQAIAETSAVSSMPSTRIEIGRRWCATVDIRASHMRVRQRGGRRCGDCCAGGLDWVLSTGNRGNASVASPRRCTMTSLRRSIVCSCVIAAYCLRSVVAGPSKAAFETATLPMAVPIWSWEADSLLQIAASVCRLERQG